QLNTEVAGDSLELLRDGSFFCGGAPIGPRAIVQSDQSLDASQRNILEQFAHSHGSQAVGRDLSHTKNPLLRIEAHNEQALALPGVRLFSHELPKITPGRPTRHSLPRPASIVFM